MFRLQHPEYIYWLVFIIPCIWILAWAYDYWRKKTLQKFGDSDLVVKNLSGNHPATIRKQLWRLTSIVFFGVMALVNPQFGVKTELIKRQGIDLVVALDVSQSMLAEDISPNRLERAKQLINRLIDRLAGDRIALIVFAGNAYVQLPPTTDYSAARLLLKTVSPDIVPAQGTAIGQAIEVATQLFADTSAATQNNNAAKTKALLLLTDGEDHESGLNEALNQAKQQQIKLYAIGVGTTQGAPIPVYVNGQRYSLKQDENGQTVNTALNDHALRNLVAQADDGQYFALNDGSGDEITDLLRSLNKLEKSNFEEVAVTEYDSRFQYPLGLCLLLLTGYLLQNGYRKSGQRTNNT
ncbi:MAG: VWA domain-containing protein [Sphingobacteriales bacterium]|jgi:Ca-activated chloride channel family protein|nr:VWA domain-containing protein [Sphingobacteriales bacterium]MBP9141397.1 VWA domain-containing protein [Chitinophagales bacterium]MDA0198112.1 VWA domain-containing protein [Bacteroidota bacterium]MBK6890148.1 VWA domain-containing protein [Sphingobacteriales bacterium]MBK7527326.1 VWA domain-containing protein [Sphingobacteriales bacterium]